MTDAAQDRLVQMDPTALRVLGPTSVQGDPVGVAPGGGSLWVANRTPRA
jgi:hypothetical protein